MPYALGDTISTAPLDGGIEISEQQYINARAAKLVGREALVLAGEFIIRDKAPSPNHTWENGEWVAPPEPEPLPEPEPEPVLSPVEKLTAFLQQNPDVLALLEGE